MDARSEPAGLACWACGAGTGPDDRFCRRCGKGQGEYVSWYYKHWGIVVATLGLGPLSLFVIWRSPVIGRNAKIAYTLVISLLTFYVAQRLYALWMFFQSAFSDMAVY